MGVVKEEEEEVSLLFSSLNDVVFHSLPNPCPCLLLYAILPLLISFQPKSPPSHRRRNYSLSDLSSSVSLSRCVLSLALSLDVLCLGSRVFILGLYFLLLLTDDACTYVLFF